MLKNILRRVLRRLHILQNSGPKDYYISKFSRRAPWVYVAYITEVFYSQDDRSIQNRHQNQREALAQVEVFHELGYNVYVQFYLSDRPIPHRKFDIVFGHEPDFVRAALMNPDALKVHYVPGAYIDHRNGQIIKMTDAVNQKYHCSIPYRRLLEYANPDHSSKVAYEMADRILMIGSHFTVDTFPAHLHSKIVTIHQSTQSMANTDDIQYASPDEYFFMGSNGNLLKGVSLLIEYFVKHPEYVLHIVGPIEDDVMTTFKSIITDNIKFYGFVDVNSDEMSCIMNRCNFIIYPSGSEGMPGAVLNSMKHGLIPIVTKWAAFDEVGEYGYVLEDWTVDAIEKGVAWSRSLSPESVLDLKLKCAKYIYDTYTIERYKKEFKDFFIQSINAKHLQIAHGE